MVKYYDVVICHGLVPNLCKAWRLLQRLYHVDVSPSFRVYDFTLYHSSISALVCCINPVLLLP